MQPRSAQKYIGTVDTVTQEFMQRINYLMTKHPQGEMPEDFQNELAKWALESICVIGLNKRLGKYSIIHIYIYWLLCKNDVNIFFVILGLLNSNLSSDSAEQTFINDVLQLFVLMNELDVKPSLWRWISTPTWRKYVKILDRVVEWVEYLYLITVWSVIRKIHNEMHLQIPAKTYRWSISKVERNGRSWKVTSWN